MAIPWDSIKSLLIFFGPILIPKAITLLRSTTKAHAHHTAIQPIPRPVKLALALLTFLSLIYLVKTLPYFNPENLFIQTGSRIQTPVDVLFNRLALLRPNNALTTSDNAIRPKFINLESRLLYLQFGPEVLAECPFCTADEPKSYFYYSLPSLLCPHIINIIAVVMATSPTLTGTYGARWRTIASIAAGVLGALYVYLVSSYNNQANARKGTLKELDMFYWDMRNYSYIALALLDLCLAWVLYLTSTHRAFFSPPSPAARVEMVNRALMTVKSRVNALGIVRNTSLRDEDLRTRGNAYWSHEVRLMREVMEEREVVEGVNDALERRINIGDITRDAETYAKNVLQPLYTSHEKNE